MKRSGFSSALLAFVIVALVVVASAAIVATQINPAVKTTSSQTQQTKTSSSSITVSNDGLRLGLIVDPEVAHPGGIITISISDFNTLGTANAPAMIGAPMVGETALTLGPCGHLPLGFGILKGYYQAGNLSQASPLILFQPGVIYSCPAEFMVAYYSFSPQSDNVSLYSPQPSGSGNATVPTRVWTSPDTFVQNFTGYWTTPVGSPGTGIFNPFPPGVYTVVGGDYWGQMAIVHFTVSSPSSASTTRSSGSGTSGGLSASVNSIQGLQLRVGLNSTVLLPGQSLQVAVSEFNTLPTFNNVSKADLYLVQVALGSCPNTYDEPFGIAVYAGHVNAQNLSQATQLEIFPLVPCPMYIRLINGYVFQPQSDSAVVLPGSSPAPMAADVNVSMIYSGQPQQLPPGAYTVVAADEWGAIAFLYFTVV